MTNGWDLSVPQRIERLRALRDFVLSIPDEEFYIEQWWCKDGLAYREWENDFVRVRDRTCGCPIGHMCHQGIFGLSPEDYKNSRERVFVIVGDALGINFKIAEFMFDQYCYSGRVTKRHVARRIEFVASEMADSTST